MLGPKRMVISMLLAHLVGDFVLQWDALAQWKAREVKGVVVHGLIILVTTSLFAWSVDPSWWQGVLLISGTHFLIDLTQFYYRPAIPPLARFTIDQLLHILVILVALVGGGYLAWGTLGSDLLASAAAAPRMTVLLGYVFITMPAWVLLKFAVYGLVAHRPPDFPAAPNKYAGIAERLLIASLVVVGSFVLVPVVAVLRVSYEWTRMRDGGVNAVYVTELLSSVALALMVGVALRIFVV